jgi:hypothetical protein
MASHGQRKGTCKGAWTALVGCFTALSSQGYTLLEEGSFLPPAVDILQLNCWEWRPFVAVRPEQGPSDFSWVPTFLNLSVVTH